MTHSTRHAFRQASRSRRLTVERLEDRRVLAPLPFGATDRDTGELLVGEVAVSVVFFESDGTTDTSTEDWTDAHRNETKAKIEEGLQWWVDLLAAEQTVHDLKFVIDYTHADTPINTGYEPINRKSNDYRLWTVDFLDEVGFKQSGDIRTDIYAYNHAQRQAAETHWGFTIFVVNSDNDFNDSFVLNGAFQQAFAFAGGRFFVFPSGRPASTVAHEAAHMFWGLDEYENSASFNQSRGYLDIQNVNAVDDNPAGSGFQQQASIMTNNTVANGDLLEQAFVNYESPASTLAMLGWRDTDDDGVFDPFDVPHSLEGIGTYDPNTRMYRFVGESSVQTLPNNNPDGFRSDITLNRLSGAQVRIDGGDWETVATFDDYQVELDFTIGPLTPGSHAIEIRTIDDATGVTSAEFQGTTERPTASVGPGINGIVWHDRDEDGDFDADERGYAGVAVQLVDSGGQRLDLQHGVEPDDYPSDFTLLNGIIPEVTLSSQGSDIADGSVFPRDGATASTGQRVFGHFRQGNVPSNSWTAESRVMKMDFTANTSTVRIDAIGVADGDQGRLEVYNSQNQLLARYTTQPLNAGQVETMTVALPTSQIAYALASGHGLSSVRLDNLVFGPASQTTTGAAGQYRFTGLDAGSYTVEVVPPTEWSPTNPSPASRTVTLGSAATQDHVDFGGTAALSHWQNYLNKFDVNADGVVAPNDILIIINDLNAVGSRTLPDPPPLDRPPPYLDVSGDTIIAPNDPLMVINFLNNSADGEGSGSRQPEGALGAARSGGGRGPGDSAEGESAFNRPIPAPEVTAERPGAVGLAEVEFESRGVRTSRSTMRATAVDRLFAESPQERRVDELETVADGFWESILER